MLRKKPHARPTQAADRPDGVRVTISCVLRLPPDFDDYAWEVESKGWFDDADIVWEGRVIRLSFYDPVRLAGEIHEEISASGVVAFRNLVVVPVVTRAAMTRAVHRLVATGEVDLLAGS